MQLNLATRLKLVSQTYSMAQLDKEILELSLLNIDCPLTVWE